MLFSKRFSENTVFTGQTVTNGKKVERCFRGASRARGVNPDERGTRRQKKKEKEKDQTYNSAVFLLSERSRLITAIYTRGRANP